MTSLQDQFVQLPQMSWRDIMLPVLDRQHRFSHEGTDHQIIYRNGVAVEMMGAGARVFTYTLPMREGITKAPHGGLFSRTLLQLWRAYHDDKSPGPLYDPVYGLITCVPQEWDETTDVQKRDGVDVRVSFKEHVPDEASDETAASSLDSITTDAKRLDEAVTRFPWPVQQPPPAATTDPLSFVTGIMDQGNFAVQRARGRVHEVAMRMNDVERAAGESERNGVPGAGVLRRSARSGRLKATRVANAPPRDAFSELVQVVNQLPSDIFVTAKELGVTVTELLTWNPFLSRNPEIAPGVRIYTRRKR